MTAVHTVLVVGGGVAGAAVAAFLADAKVNVDLVEVKPGVGALGSGITLQGNALRVLQQLGVLDDCLAEGFAAEKLVIRAPDPAATVIAEVREAHTGGPDLPTSMGMYRPALARILMARAEKAGVKVRFATTVEAIEHNVAGAVVRFSDGSIAHYDLVIAADGVRSPTRGMLDIAVETRPVGMGIWRVSTPRPASVVSSEAVYGGPCYIAGYTPTSDSGMYAFLVEDAQDRTGVTPAEKVDIVRALSQAYHGPWDEIRDSINDPDAINYTWFEEHLLDPPWNSGRVVFIGDAAHVCPPTLAQGGAMALEDATVLAELLINRDAVDDELWRQFTERRFDRVKTVVEGSLRIARWQIAHERGDVPALMGKIAALTSQPA